MSHIYIHIPFCESKCHYCSFNSFAGFKKNTIRKYFDALKIQLEFEIKRFELEKNSVTTVYFGGGTPSSVDANLYEPIFDIINNFASSHIEITVEANPSSSNTNWLDKMRKLGANRISLGVQSFDDKKLHFLGRLHSSESAKNAISRAVDSGFQNISIDLIYDTQYDSVDFVKKEVDVAVSMPVTHISAYSLSIEENSLFANKHDLKVENIDSYRVIVSTLQQHGFEQYEVSNFGKIKSNHNTAYWLGEDYIGAGAGAVGFLKNSRFYPMENIDEYISNPTKINIETVAQNDLRFEKVFLGIRSNIGVSINDIKCSKEKIDYLKNSDKIDIRNGRIFAKDFLLADEIALYLENF